MPVALYIFEDNNLTHVVNQPKAGFDTTIKAQAWAKNNVDMTEKGSGMITPTLVTVRTPLTAFKIETAVTIKPITAGSSLFAAKEPEVEHDLIKHLGSSLIVEETTADKNSVEVQEEVIETVEEPTEVIDEETGEVDKVAEVTPELQEEPTTDPFETTQTTETEEDIW